MTESPTERRARIGAAELVLQRATIDADPACLDDARFTADERLGSDLADMATTCLRCPVLEACTAYAEAVRPGAGYWAGRWWGHAPGRAMKARERPDIPTPFPTHGSER